ncbi:MAG TPA: methyltransferase domain-containing protein, partial [Tepidisphaeraceae bacterium]
TNPRNEWIFFVDADERITSKCAAAICSAVSSPGPHDGFFVCYRNIFLNRWIRHCKMFPTWQLRILRLRRVRYRKEGHGQREVMSGSAGYIREPFDHLDLSKGLPQWIERHNVYSTNEVELIRRLREEPLMLRDLLWGDPVQRRRCLKRVGARFGASPILWFLYLYIIQLGFLDGRPGLTFCLLRLAQQIHIKAKLEEASLASHGLPQATMPPKADSAIDFHEQMAQQWEGKYDKLSFFARVNVLEECIRGIDLRGHRWLDAGCGTATLGRVLAKRGCIIYAVDAAPTMLRIASDLARREGLDHVMTFEQVDSIENLDPCEARFDGVLCNSVVEYLSRPGETLARMAKALRPGGIMLVSVPNRASLLRRMLCMAYRVTHWLTGRGRPAYLHFSHNEYGRHEFSKMLSEMGLEVEKVIYFGGPMPHAMQQLSFMGPLCMYVARARATSRDVKSPLAEPPAQQESALELHS